MNKFDLRYDFRLATVDDIEDIMEYIDTVWKKGHILSQNEDFFRYEFQNGERIHFIIVRDKQNGGRIAGINGYYPCSKDSSNLDIWGTMWSVREDFNNIPMLGVEIARRRDAMIGSRSETGVGDNEKTAIPLLGKILKNKVGILDHYYMLNDLSRYKIAVINDRIFNYGRHEPNKEYSLKFISCFEELDGKIDFERFKEHIPYKDGWYLNKRFFHHPVYEYKVYGVKNRDGCYDTVLIFREVSVDDSKVLRLVDVTGDKTVLRYLAKQLRDLMKEDMKIEYMDFYCYGFDQEDLRSAGFVKRDENDSNIIPNYFEPFLQKNVDIWFNSTCENVTICKADADQDRPNKVNQKEKNYD